MKIERDGESLIATPTGNQGSGILSSLSRADGLLIGPSATTLLKAGDHATVLLLGAGAGELGADTDETSFEGRRHKY